MKSRLITTLATGLGPGLFPFAPGTVGSAWALVILLAGRHALATAGIAVPYSVISVSLVLFCAAGIVICSAAEKVMGEDNGHIVIDEMAGMWITLLFVPVSTVTVMAAFGLFRLFDILKPFPVNRMEKLGGGPGVMADDIMAGIMGNIILQGYVWLTVR